MPHPEEPSTVLLCALEGQLFPLASLLASAIKPTRAPCCFKALTNCAEMQPASSLVAQSVLPGTSLDAFPEAEAEEPGARLLRWLVQAPWPSTGLLSSGATHPQAELGGFTSGHKRPEVMLNRRQSCKKKKKGGKFSNLSRADN